MLPLLAARGVMRVNTAVTSTPAVARVTVCAIVTTPPTHSEQPLAPHYLRQPPARQLGQHVAVEEHAEDHSLVVIIVIVIIIIIIITTFSFSFQLKTPGSAMYTMATDRFTLMAYTFTKPRNPKRGFQSLAFVTSC